MTRFTVLAVVVAVAALVPSLLAAIHHEPSHDLGSGRRIVEAAPMVAAPSPAETTITLGPRFADLVAAAKPKFRHRGLGSRSASPSFVYPTDALLDALARCETGGTMDPRAEGHEGDLTFYSFFQWTLGTWHAIGGQGHPFDAPYAVQRDLARALILAPGKGWRHFPYCSRAIGAR